MSISHSLTSLTHNNVPFIWSDEVQQAMDLLKHAIISSTYIHPIDYTSQDEVILAVDSSHIACGWILSQVSKGKWYPSCFGSITWNDCESRYSQAKIELYSLFVPYVQQKFGSSDSKPSQLNSTQNLLKGCFKIWTYIQMLQ